MHICGLSKMRWNDEVHEDSHRRRHLEKQKWGNHISAND